MVAVSKKAFSTVTDTLRATLFAILLLQLSRQVIAQHQPRDVDGTANMETPSDSDDPPVNARIPLNQIPQQAIPYVPPPSDFPPDEWGNRIPDFSQVGYRRGHVPLPQVPVTITLQPSSDPRINDRARIQNAIDWVGRQPLLPFTLRDKKTVIQTRGAVLLQAGLYRLQGSLILNRSGVVLRGEGTGPDGTILMALGQFKHDLIYMNGLLDSSFQGTPEYLVRYADDKAMRPRNPFVVQDQHVAHVADEYIPVGTTRLPVKDTSNFKIGSRIVVERRPEVEWVHFLGMDHIPPRPDDPERTVNWDARQYKVRYVREVLGIERETTFKEMDVVAQHHKTERQQRKKSRGRAPESVARQAMRYVADTNRTGHATAANVSNTDTKTPLSDAIGNKASKTEGGADDSADEEEEEEEEEEEHTKSHKKDNPHWNPGYLKLDVPIVMNMDPIHGSGVVYNFERETPIPTDVGVENLALFSEYDPQNLSDERHGWFAISIDNCEHCWVTDVKANNFVSGIKADPGSKHITIQDCEILEPVSLRDQGRRRYMYMLHGQMGLVKRCFATDARHDFMTGSTTAGPNVFVDSEGLRANNDAGPHDRWTTGTLYDNIHSHRFNVRNRGWMGSGQGWSGVFHVIYHCSADDPVEFQSPPGGTNWVIGFQGQLNENSAAFPGDDATFLDPEPQDLDKIPRSLYWSQLVARMGGTNQSAMTVENYVGVAGKNQYPAPLPRQYVNTEEIIASQKRVQMDEERLEQDPSETDDLEGASAAQQAMMEIEKNITSTTNIQEAIKQFEMDLWDEAVQMPMEICHSLFGSSI